MTIPKLTKIINGVKFPVVGWPEMVAAGETVMVIIGLGVVVGDGKGVATRVGALVGILVGRGVIGVGVGETLPWAATWKRRVIVCRTFSSS